MLERLLLIKGMLFILDEELVGRLVMMIMMVKRMTGCIAANGTKITNYGERILRGLNGEGKEMPMAGQAADVCQLVASVGRMNQVGNAVVPDG